MTLFKLVEAAFVRLLDLSQSIFVSEMFSIGPTTFAEEDVMATEGVTIFTHLHSTET